MNEPLQAPYIAAEIQDVQQDNYRTKTFVLNAALDAQPGQFVMVRGEQKGSPVVDEYFINVGGTYWLNDSTSLGARVGYYRFVTEEKAYGDMSIFLTARAIL